MLAPMPCNNSEPITTTLGRDERFVQLQGEIWGRLETRDPTSGEWSSQRAQGIRNGANFEVLTVDQLNKLQGPLTTPTPTPSPNSPPPLVVPDWANRNEPSPGYLAPPPAGPTVLVTPAELMRLDDLIIESRGIGSPGSAEHKAAARDAYELRGGEWDYDRWSGTYEQNQVRAADANRAVDQYRNQIGWGVREVTVYANIDGIESARRLDIADQAGRLGIEYKTGYQTASVDNLWELKRDAELVQRGWKIEWVFRDQVSQPLLDALDRAGIKYKTGS
jgi:hypothetical protein